MPPKSDLNSFKTNMKKQTSKIINQLGLTDEQSQILKTDAHKLIKDGKMKKIL